MVICIETATNLCSVVLCDNSGITGLRESDESKSHASLLTVFIDELLKEREIEAHDLEAIAVSKGPGSYTGLRIGVSVAKGIAYGASIPLIGIETPLSMFYGLIENYAGDLLSLKNSLFCPMLDARRMEVYYALYDSRGHTVKDISAEIINERTFDEFPDSQNIILFGDGAAKCRELIKHPNTELAEGFFISAKYMFRPVMKAIHNRHFEDVAYFEPFYLKDFITTKSTKNIFGK